MNYTANKKTVLTLEDKFHSVADNCFKSLYNAVIFVKYFLLHHSCVHRDTNENSEW